LPQQTARPAAAATRDKGHRSFQRCDPKFGGEVGSVRDRPPIAFTAEPFLFSASRQKANSVELIDQAPVDPFLCRLRREPV